MNDGLLTQLLRLEIKTSVVIHLEKVEVDTFGNPMVIQMST